MIDAVRRPLAASLLLLVAYALLSLTTSEHGYLGTDTGAKVATLDAMVEAGSWTPDVGYWAERWDPDGNLHPIYKAHRSDEGWVHVTTLPMLEVGRVLYDIGGYRLTLALPMLGAVGAAHAARSLARRMRPQGDGWAAFYVVGLTSPLLVYALDFWEHAPGVACIVGAVALLAGAFEDDGSLWWRGTGAGVLLGSAATMRNETFVYGLVAVGVACLLLLAARRLRRAVALGALSVVGFVPPWLLNQVLEGAVGGISRADRATGAASSGGGDLGTRATEAFVTTVGLFPSDGRSELVLGAAVVLLLAAVVVTARRGDVFLSAVLAAVVGAAYLYRFVDGLGFVPGLFMAAPLAVVALVVRPSGRAAQYCSLVAVLSLPLVWAFQYTGGAIPQWAGRYTLSSAVLLTVVGVAATGSLPRGTARFVLGLTVALGAFAVLWLGERSREIDRGFRDLADRPEDVIVVRNGFLVREGGAVQRERRWLTAVSDQDLVEASEVVRDAGLETFAVLDEDPTPPTTVGEARLVDEAELVMLGVRFHLHVYEV